MSTQKAKGSAVGQKRSNRVASLALILWNSVPDALWKELNVESSDYYRYDSKTKSVYFQGGVKRGRSHVTVIIGAQEHQNYLHKATVVVGSDDNLDGSHTKIFPNGHKSQPLNRTVITEAIEREYVKQVKRIEKKKQELAAIEREAEIARLSDEAYDQFERDVISGLGELNAARQAYLNEDVRHKAAVEAYCEEVNSRYRGRYTYYRIDVAGVNKPIICVGGETEERQSLTGQMQTYYRTIGDKGECLWSRFPAGISVETTIEPNAVVPDEKGRKPFHITVRLAGHHVFIPVHIKDAKLVAESVASQVPQRFMKWGELMERIKSRYDEAVIQEVMKRYEEQEI